MSPSLGNGDKVIFRPALPIIGDAPDFDGATKDFDSESGIGDVGFDLIYASTSKSGFLTGYGIAGSHQRTCQLVQVIKKKQLPATATCC